ncbi:MAG: B12-binding domain-containing radical SAM protein [Bacteroidota bacterium]
MKHKLLLINPDYQVHVKDFYEPIELGIIASLTPKEEWDVEVMDLRVDDFEVKDVDLVGITARILNINDTYRILEKFKSKGITTVIGGIHASLFPGESLQYADSVVIGEAESIWNDLLNDYKESELKERYYGDTKLDYTLQRSVYKHHYKTATLQLSRGCPLACDFCCINKIHKQRHFYRDIDYVIDEIKHTKQKTLFFTDENIYGFNAKNRNHVIRLFKEMIRQKLNKHWIAMVSVNAGMDDEFLYYARKSGCRLLVVGFEAEDEETLRLLNKTQNVKNHKNYKKIIDNIHKNRIALCGVFMFGLENDTLETIKKRKKYMLKLPIDSYLVTLLTPLPGSRLFDRHLKRHNLIYTKFPDDWGHYNFYTPHFKDYKIPNLTEVFGGISNNINKPRLLMVKFVLSIIRTKSLSSALYSNFYMCNHRSEVNDVKILKWINDLFDKSINKKNV